MRRHELENHRRKLGQIRDILASMKTLAAMETHKLRRFIEAQKQMGNAITEIAADFLCFHPGVLPRVESQFDIILLIGSERGFCGDYNDRLIEMLHQRFTAQAQEQAKLIMVGSKLHPLLNLKTDQITRLQGADIADEIVSVLDSLVESLASCQQVASFHVIYHGDRLNEIVTAKLLPPFEESSKQACTYSTPPLLNMSATKFLLELTDHYLFNALHRILYSSLMAENQHRIQHLEHATRHLDDSTEELGRKINALRQEEITEEIEVILLNTSTT